MDPFDFFHDPFLHTLSSLEKAKLKEKIEYWGLSTQSFATRVDNWFCNFDELDDKRLALKIFHSLKYYSSEAFTARLLQLYGAIERHLADTGNNPSDIVLVTPDGHADSADRHAYDLIKHGGLLRGQVYNINELAGETFEDPVFVLFNDTHGTGNQFLRELWPALEPYGEHKIYILAIAISEKALDNFRTEMPRVHVLPKIPVTSAWSEFTGQECNRIREIGEKVYAKHPMGYGDAALLTAYYFQCPNNTIPIVWADGQNNKINGHTYSWSPLFPYLPKRKLASASQQIPQILAKAKKKKNVLIPNRAKREERKLAYRYRVGLLDLDLGLTNIAQLAEDLNRSQTYFHFTAPHNDEVRVVQSAVIPIDSQKNLSVYAIGKTFFEQFDELAVDVVGCFTRYPLAFDNGETIEYNYISGPSNEDTRFMFVSAYQLRRFTKVAACSLEEGMTHILVSQLVVYFTDVGFHHKIRSCPMDFCEIKEEIVKSLKKRQFCRNCQGRIQDASLMDALNALLLWHP